MSLFSAPSQGSASHGDYCCDGLSRLSYSSRAWEPMVHLGLPGSFRGGPTNFPDLSWLLVTCRDSPSWERHSLDLSFLRTSGVLVKPLRTPFRVRAFTTSGSPYASLVPVVTNPDLTGVGVLPFQPGVGPE